MATLHLNFRHVTGNIEFIEGLRDAIMYRF